MKQKTIFIIFTALCISAIAIGAVWAFGHIESLFAYRSPLDGIAPQPGEPLGEPLTRRLVVVLVDALRDDTSRDGAIMPELKRLRASGASASTRVGFPSYSQPGYGTILTGAWPELNSAPAMNAEYTDIPRLTQDNIFSAAKRAGYATAISAFNWFEKLLPAESITTSFYTKGEDRLADQEVMDAALPWLDRSEFSFVFIHLDQVDYAGHHEGGAVSQGWREAASRVDDMLREVSSRIDFNKDTLLVLSDHGQIDRGGHGGNEPEATTGMFVLAGNGVVPGDYGTIDLADAAPTIAALLGSSLPASSQGKARTEMLTLNEGALARVAALEPLQKSALELAYRQAIGVKSQEAGIHEARDMRLNQELLFRGLWIIPLILVVIYALVRYTVGEKFVVLSWAATGIAIFFALYTLVDGYTCSLSSVDGVEQIITYFGTRGAICFSIVSLAIWFFLRLWKRTAVESAIQIIHASLLASGILVLPVLYSTWLNGWQASWMLPEPLSAFLGMASAVLAAVFCATALPLAGLAALISTLKNK